MKSKYFQRNVFFPQDESIKIKRKPVNVIINVVTAFYFYSNQNFNTLIV